MRIIIALIIFGNVFQCFGELTNSYILLIDHEHSEFRGFTSNSISLGSRSYWGERSYSILAIDTSKPINKSDIATNAVKLTKHSTIQLEGQVYRVVEFGDDYVALENEGSKEEQRIERFDLSYSVKILDGNRLQFLKR